jgi:hypothetical protein
MFFNGVQCSSIDSIQQLQGSYSPAQALQQKLQRVDAARKKQLPQKTDHP